MACHSSATTRAPSSWAFSGPMTPFCSGTSSTFFSRQHLPDVELRVLLGQHVAERLAEQRAQLVAQRRDGGRGGLGRQAVEPLPDGPAANGSSLHDAAGQASGGSRGWSAAAAA